MRRSYIITFCILSSLLVIGGVCALPWNGGTLLEWWRDSRSGSIYHSAQTSARLVALTFDDGPDPRYTPKVLDILRANRVRATFFVVGQQVDRHPELARRIVAEGHVMGNHTFTHPHLENERDPLARQELESCERRIESITGERTYLFRPPRGLWNPVIFRDAQRMGYSIVLWSVAFDRAAIHDPDVLRRRVVRLTRPGGIVLMHDGSASTRDERRATVRELDGVIHDLRRRGFRFVTVPDLLHISGNAAVRTAARPRG